MDKYIIVRAHQQIGKTDEPLEIVNLNEVLDEVRATIKEIIEELRKLTTVLPRITAHRKRRYALPIRPERTRAKPKTDPPGGVLWLKCARRFKKGNRSDHTGGTYAAMPVCLYHYAGGLPRLQWLKGRMRGLRAEHEPESVARNGCRDKADFSKAAPAV